MTTFKITLESGKEIYTEQRNKTDTQEYAERYDINRGYNFTIEEVDEE